MIYETLDIKTTLRGLYDNIEATEFCLSTNITPEYKEVLNQQLHEAQVVMRNALDILQECRRVQQNASQSEQTDATPNDQSE